MDLHNYTDLRVRKIDIFAANLNSKQLGALVSTFNSKNPFYTLIGRKYTDQSRREEYELYLLPNISCHSGTTEEVMKSFELAESTSTIKDIEQYIKGFIDAIRSIG